MFKNFPLAKSLLYFLVVTILGLTLIFNESRLGSRTDPLREFPCPSERVKKMYATHYEGVIVKKYNDDYDHGFPKIDVLQEKGKITLSFTRAKAYDTPFGADLWNYTTEGDTFIKPKNSFRVEIRRDTTTETFDIDCDKHKKQFEKNAVPFVR